MDWSKLPDLGAAALLLCAFASVARRSHTPVSRLWLTGWLMIVMHFAAFLFIPLSGIWGDLATFITLAGLVWAGILFMWASVPYRHEHSSSWMFAIVLSTNTLYISLTMLGRSGLRALAPAAILLGALPLAYSLISLRRLNHSLRWTTVILYSTLSIFLLHIQHKPGYGSYIAINALIFVVYFDCCIHFWYTYRRATAGAFITIAGFFTWASVFIVRPWIETLASGPHLESEVWNLPKYIVSVGMILLLLEDQIEHNKHLALHDELTGLPNRRLFQDRLASALERARRTGTRAALLVVDLDHFKQVNDTHGHHVGDLLLQNASSIFAGRLRRSDTVARTGGDEFCIILEDPTSREYATIIGQSLLQKLKEPMKLGNQEVSVGASVGVAIYPEDACDAESLCIAADLRMYEDKHETLDPCV